MICPFKIVKADRLLEEIDQVPSSTIETIRNVPMNVDLKYKMFSSFSKNFGTSGMHFAIQFKISLEEKFPVRVIVLNSRSSLLGILLTFSCKLSGRMGISTLFHTLELCSLGMI